MTSLPSLPSLSSLPSLCTGLLLCTILAAQDDLLVKPCGGGIGRTLLLEISGGNPSESCFLATSLQRASIPLSNFDGMDPRTIRVGLDLPALHLFLRLDSQGRLKLAFPLPNDSGLIGLATLHQAATYPGKATLADEVSDVSVVLYGQGGGFQAQKNLASARTRPTHIPLGDGLHLIVGGGSGTPLWQAARNTTEVYDEQSRSFTAGPLLTAGRAAHAQVLLQDGRTMLIGGVDANNAPQTSTEFFDPKTGKFTAGPPMANKRMGHTATLLTNGKVLVTGGIPDTSTQNNALTSALRSTEIYDPTTNKWASGPNLSTYRAMHSAIVLADGRVLLPGGLSWRSLLFFKLPQISNTCDLYDPKNNSMSSAGSMQSIRSMYAATLLPNGKVLVAGGLAGVIDTSNAGTPINAAEIYDPQTNRWSAATAMTGSRAMPTDVMLSDGRFMVLGGGSGSLWSPTATQTAEIYDHTTNKWSAMPNMVATRAGALAIELRACGILVLGGGTGSSATSTNTTELFLW